MVSRSIRCCLSIRLKRSREIFKPKNQAGALLPPDLFQNCRLFLSETSWITSFPLEAQNGPGDAGTRDTLWELPLPHAGIRSYGSATRLFDSF